MDGKSLASLLRAELSPLYEELVRIRVALERLDRFASPYVEDAPRAAAPAPPDLEAESAGGMVAEAASADLVPPSPTAARPGRITPRSDPTDLTPDPDQVDLLEQLLALYPGDAAAVFYGFDRQYRCSPDYLDQLAERTGYLPAWHHANRSSIRHLLERFHGGREIVAETLGRDMDSFLALVERTGIGEHMEAVRAREVERLRNARLPQLLGQILFRERLLHDLGILDELDERAWQELQEQCTALSGECASAIDVLERLTQECNLERLGVDRLLRRYDLRGFVADLYQDPVESERPTLRRQMRADRRRALSDSEIETRILHMLLTKRKVGAAHTHIDHLVRTVPPHERGRAREVIERLRTEGILVRKVTDNSSEPHVSVAVSAVPAVEERLRATGLTSEAPKSRREPVES